MTYNLNTVFIRICEKLNLSETLHKNLEDRYEAVSGYLASCPGCEQLKMYPQGSIAIGTTVKPIGWEEFDLDFVCESENINPFKLFEIIKLNLKSNGRYANLVEEKKRCVRLNYKGDFHLDILPACRNGRSGILIPDQELKRPIESNPKGYIAWFERKGVAVLRKDAEIETLPLYQSANQKNYLQCIVQLIKRNRNIFFKLQPEQAPASIILTTLCGERYQNMGDIFDELNYILGSIREKPPMEIYNPVNSRELLSEEWKKNPLLYGRFMQWMETLGTDLDLLKRTNNKEKKLEEMFGETIVRLVLDELHERELIHRNRKKLSVSSSGILTFTQNNNNTPVCQNTFYGSEEE